MHGTQGHATQHRRLVHILKLGCTAWRVWGYDDTGMCMESFVCEACFWVFGGIGMNEDAFYGLRRGRDDTRL